MPLPPIATNTFHGYAIIIITRSLRLLAKRAARPRYPPPFPYLDIFDVILVIMTSQGLQMVAT